MPTRCPGNFGARFENDLALEGHAWQSVLLEEDDVARVQTKVVVLYEKLLRRFLSILTRHHVPAQ